MTQVSGNLISSVALNGQDATPHTQLILFSTYLSFMAVSLVCCIVLLKDKLPPSLISASTVNMTMSDKVPLLSALGDEPPSSATPKATLSPWEVLKATMKLVMTRKMLLVLPVFYTCGVQSGFSFSVFTHEVINPALGVSSIGYARR
jgi:hypothetical protein